MKQKVALISALAHDPKVLVMDEPFVGLDPKAVFDMKNIMKEMTKEGKTIFFSTHILDGGKDALSMRVKKIGYKDIFLEEDNNGTSI